MLLPADKMKENEMEVQHEYRVHAFGAGGRNGVVQAQGVLSSISFSAPPEFLGEPGRWTPEHFLVAALASCFVSTFSGIAEKSRLNFASFNLDAEGLLSNADGVWRFKEIDRKSTRLNSSHSQISYAVFCLKKKKKEKQK